MIIFKTVYTKELIACHDCHMKRLPKARELSLYEKENENVVAEYDQSTRLPLISEISTVRQKAGILFSYLTKFKEQTVHIYETGVAHSSSTYDYLKSEENKVPRIAAIASGGLVGVFLARKRGVFKKLIYTSVGTGLVFSAFYPEIAKEYLSSGYEYTKQQGSHILEKYGGYDTKKLSEQTNEKFELVKSTMKLEGLTNKLNDVFHKSKESVSQSINSITKKTEEQKADEPSKEK